MRSSIVVAALLSQIAFQVVRVHGFSSSPIERNAMMTPARQQSMFPLEMSSNMRSESESSTRRQLLFSMLAASGSLLVPPNQASAEDSAVTTVQAVSEAAAALNSWSNINIIKPPTDDRDYLAFIMENGLRVVLCSDPQSTEAGAAMDCHVGACSDPKEIRGLAHFCEHMVSMTCIVEFKEDSGNIR